MPMELRKLVFSKDELRAAVYGYCLHVGKKMPAAAASDLTIRSEPDFVVSLHFDADHSGSGTTVDLFGPEVAAALIRYSRQIGVPIPRNAKKAVQSADDGVAMMINLKYQAQAANAA